VSDSAELGAERRAPSASLVPVGRRGSVAGGTGEGNPATDEFAVTQLPVRAPVLSAGSRARIAGAIGAARAENTTRAYRADWDRFTQWCERRPYAPLPAHPLVLADYLTEHADQTATPTTAQVGI
jgi:hypothetical protein